MEKYRVVEVKEQGPDLELVPEEYRYEVKALMDTYGLWGHLDPKLVFAKWKSYSVRSAAGWLIPDDVIEVEGVLGVKLEPDND